MKSKKLLQSIKHLLDIEVPKEGIFVIGNTQDKNPTTRGNNIICVDGKKIGLLYLFPSQKNSNSLILNFELMREYYSQASYYLKITMDWLEKFAKDNGYNELNTCIYQNQIVDAGILVKIHPYNPIVLFQNFAKFEIYLKHGYDKNSFYDERYVCLKKHI